MLRAAMAALVEAAFCVYGGRWTSECWFENNVVVDGLVVRLSGIILGVPRDGLCKRAVRVTAVGTRNSRIQEHNN